MGQSTGMLALRVVLGVTFIWAGLGKLMATEQLTPEVAARAATLGLIDAPSGQAPTPDPSQPSESGENGDPDAPPGDPPADNDSESTPDDGEAGSDSDDGASDDGGPLSLSGDVLRGFEFTPVAFTQDDAAGGGDEAADAADPADDAPPDAGQPAFTADDFPEGASVKRRVNIGLLVGAAADPAPLEDTGEVPMALAPEFVGKSPWPSFMAWAASLTELIAGVFLLFGFLTRLSALSGFGVMVVAVWLTTVGPAIQEGSSVLGFIPLPDHPAFSLQGWTVPLWQFAMLGMTLAVVCIGPGGASLDRMIGSRRGRDGSDDD